LSQTLVVTNDGTAASSPVVIDPDGRRIDATGLKSANRVESILHRARAVFGALTDVDACVGGGGTIGGEPI
jgi:hypothetical protein